MAEYKSYGLKASLADKMTVRQRGMMEIIEASKRCYRDNRDGKGIWGNSETLIPCTPVNRGADGKVIQNLDEICMISFVLRGKMVTRVRRFQRVWLVIGF